MEKITVAQLIEATKLNLETFNFSKWTIDSYTFHWKQLAKFAEEKQAEFYTPKLGQEMGCCIKDYVDKVHRDSEPGRPFFPSNDGKFYAQCSIHAVYRELLRKAGISHGGKGKGPRIHDMRHTFAVTCLKKWALAGEDMTSALPLLSAYMGHVNLSSTAVYLRLTADLFPYIADTSEKHLEPV